MATQQDLIDDLADRLNDAAHSQVTLARKQHYLNLGIRATWPSLYTTARDSTLTVVAGQTEYNVPASVGSNTRIFRVEVESGVATNYYTGLTNYEVIPDITSPILALTTPISLTAGARFRITAAKRIPDLVNTTDVYLGPAGTEELPVLYAMGVAMARRVDDRVDYKRMSTTQGSNSVETGDLMDASQFWFAQFEILLDRFAMPMPVSDF